MNIVDCCAVLKNVVDYNTAQREYCLLHYNLYGIRDFLDCTTVIRECC